MMHITVTRTLGLLLFLALVGYAFFLGPWITASSAHDPASSATVRKAVPPRSVAPRSTPPAVAPPTPSQASLFRAE